MTSKELFTRLLKSDRIEEKHMTEEMKHELLKLGVAPHNLSFEDGKYYLSEKVLRFFKIHTV